MRLKKGKVGRKLFKHGLNKHESATFVCVPGKRAHMSADMDYEIIAF